MRQQARKREWLTPHAGIDEQRAAQRALAQAAQERPVAPGMVGLHHRMGKDGRRPVTNQQHLARQRAAAGRQPQRLPFIGEGELHALCQAAHPESA